MSAWSAPSTPTPSWSSFSQECGSWRSGTWDGKHELNCSLFPVACSLSNVRRAWLDRQRRGAGVDVQDCAGHLRGLVRGEVEHGVGRILRRLMPPKRKSRAGPLELLGGDAPALLQGTLAFA